MLILVAPLAASCSAPLPAEASPSRQSAQPPGQVQPVDAAAFPGAVGYGAVSVGGHGGRIIPVTSLDDAGDGSLRACIDATGPRVCIFRVNGVIRFTTAPPIIRNPFITIAGQTAPGAGITLSHAGGPNGRTPLVIKGTHDVIVRHIRVRTDIAGEHRESEDGITIEQSERVILDHLSASWARDELVNGFADNDQITISNSIFAAGIPRHDKCALLASDPVDAQRVSFIGNICAHNGDRNPDINFPPGSCVEVVNNLFFNAQSEFAEIWESEGGSPVSVVGNLFLAGPSTSASAIGIVRAGIAATGTGKLYLWDNHFEGDFIHQSPSVSEILVAAPPCPLTVSPTTSASLMAELLDRAGAWPRDSFDKQVLREVRDRSGRVGAEPVPLAPTSPAEPYPDRDGDGMDDEWETSHGSSAAESDPWGDADGDGIANFDEFLVHLESRPQVAGSSR